MRVLKYFLLSILLLSSCDKFEWHNPYDPECPKELFTPSSPGATMEGNSVKLTWSQSNDDISGFALYRSADGEPIANLTQTQKSTTQYLDASITPGKKYTYYVLAVAGTNKSDTIKAEITPIFPITISTGAVTELAATSAKVSGNITSAGGGTVTSRGICWSTTQNPTVNNSKTTEGTGAGQYTSTLNGLPAGTTYYARAYGENSRGIVYGSQVTFTTLGPPTVTTTAASNITATSATSGGTIISDGGSPITAKGVVWSTSPNPTIDLATKTNDGTGLGVFTSSLSNLSANTKYYIRAYATNIVGTTYGEEQIMNTLSTPPPTLNTGLIAYFPLDGNASDLSGNNVVLNNFGVVGSRNRKGELNKALFFDGQSYLGGTIQNIPIGNQDRSFSFWARQTRNDNQLEYTIFNYGLQQLSQIFSLMYRPDLPNMILWFDDIAPSYSQFASTNTQTFKQINTLLGNWNHIVVTVKARLISCYINGELVFTSQRDLINTQYSNFLIGKFADPPYKTAFFYGDIDEFYIYNRALTQEEITYLANN